MACEEENSTSAQECHLELFNKHTVRRHGTAAARSVNGQRCSAHLWTDSEIVMTYSRIHTYMEGPRKATGDEGI